VRTDTEHVSARLAAIQGRIQAAWDQAESSVRADRVRVVGVTKYLEPGQMLDLRAAGLEIFGENRAQLATAKLEVFAGQPAARRPCEWHFIGTLQSNKVRQVVGRFDLIHSVDRMELALALSREAVGLGLVQRVLLQVNVSREASKHGFPEADLDECWPELRALPGLRWEGLMGMAAEEGDARAEFRRLRLVRDRLDPAHGMLRELSMGMSGDFEEAVLEGASLVRVGTVLFSEEAGSGWNS
jgi:pyridoxal phosphate enzyme (YggS family)